ANGSRATERLAPCGSTTTTISSSNTSGLSMCDQCDCERRLECLRIAADVNEGAPSDVVLNVAKEFADFVFCYEPGEYDGPESDDDDDHDPPEPDAPAPTAGPDLTEAQ